MNTYKVPVVSNTKLQHGTYLLKVHSPELASEILPGQFCNIKVSESDFPLLRRPFSICDVEDEYIFFMFDVHGEGTRILAEKAEGDVIDVLGSLGNGFGTEGEYETAVIVAGGIGAAPYPYLTRTLQSKKKIRSFIGGRSAENVITYGFENYEIATDDGSAGLHGNVIDLFDNHLNSLDKESIKVFGCGPNPMLRALQEYCLKHEIDCEVSLESAMACGFGICQGCPTESKEDSDKYKLICKDGPVFNIKDVKI